MAMNHVQGSQDEGAEGEGPEVADSGKTSQEVPLDQLETQITELAAHLNAATWRWLSLVGEFDRREGWATWSCRSCAQWLSWRAGVSLAAAHEQVRVARRLGELPLVSTAFRRGEPSYSKARALTRVATPANEVDLVSLALHATAAQLDRLVRAYRQATAGGREEANARHARRYLRWYWDDDGSLSISGRLCPEDGAVVAAALKAAGLVADQRRRTKDRDQGQSGARDQPATETPAGESGGRAAAEAPAGGFGGGAGGESPAGDSGGQTGTDPSAGVAAANTGTETPAGESDTPAEVSDWEDDAYAGVGDPYSGGPVEMPARSEAEDEPDDPWAAHQADALVGVAESFLANGPPASAPHAQVVLHVGLDALSGDGEGMCELEDGPALVPETARRLGCDAAVVRIIESGDGQPLDVGRSTRTVSPALRRALKSRDRGCRFPSCGQTRFLHAHHVRHWAQGGATSLANLLTLCTFHHRALHEGGYTAEVATGETVVFRRPDGQVIEEAVATALDRPGQDTVVAANRRLGLAIDSETSVPGWGGERLDYGLAVDALLCLDGRMNDDWKQTS